MTDEERKLLKEKLHSRNKNNIPNTSTITKNKNIFDFKHIFSIDKKFIIFGVVGLLIVVIIFGRIAKRKNTEKHYREFCKETIAEDVNVLDSTYEHLDSFSSLVLAVWHDAIYEEKNVNTMKYTYYNYGFYSFNEALQNLYSDEDCKDLIKGIGDLNDNSSQCLKLLNGVPEKYKNENKEAIQLLKELYLINSQMLDAVEEPTGSYDSYSSDISSLKKDYKEKRNSLDLILELNDN